MADDDPKQPKKPQSTQKHPEPIRDAIKEAVRRARGFIQAPAMDVEAERSGQLAPPHSPTIRDVRDGQPSGWARSRHPADSPPPSITESILRDPGRHLPPEPEPEHDRDTEREQ